jgi:Tfp pilus assembly protein PilF
MNQTESESKRQKKYKAYFVVGIILLVVMALGWAIDPSLNYIFLGCAVFFLFLGFWNMPRSSANSYRTADRMGGSRASQGASFNQWIENISKKKPARPDPPASTQQKSRFVFTVAVVVFGIFIFTVIVNVVSSDYSSEDATYFYDQAEQFRNVGQYDSADRYYRKALVINPDFPLAWNAYGVGWRDREGYDSAEAAFEKAVDLDPAYQEALYNLALTHHYQKNYEKSLRESLQLIRESPEYMEAILLTGSNYYAQQRYDSAIYFYEDVYGKGQRGAWLCHVMAYIYDTRGDQQRAIPLYQEALSYDSNLLAVYERLGELFPGADGNSYRQKVQELKAQGY